MRKIFSTILVLSAGVFAQNGTDGAKGTDVAISSFAFMKGCWVIERPERKVRIEEQWMAPAGGTMIGMSRTVRDGKTTGWEFMRIETGDAGVFFVSKPRENKEETRFKLSAAKWKQDPSQKSVAAIFENSTHDFPQRVIYVLDDPDSLSARIEGTQDGKSSGIDFHYKRVKCE